MLKLLTRASERVGEPAIGERLDQVVDGVHLERAHGVVVECGDEDDEVLGNVAVLQGSVTETRSTDGQSTTYRVAYMDVWEKRGDRWVVVRSYATKL